MKTTRMGMFETNSSSSHCMVLNGPESIELDLMDVALPSFEGTLLLHPQIFGDKEGVFNYEKKILTSSWDKLNYFATYILDDLGPDWPSYPEKQLRAKKLLAQAVTEVTGLKIIWPEEYKAKTDNLNDYFEAKAFESKESLIQAIFNPNFVIKLNYWGDYDDFE